MLRWGFWGLVLGCQGLGLWQCRFRDGVALVPKMGLGRLKRFRMGAHRHPKTLNPKPSAAFVRAFLEGVQSRVQGFWFGDPTKGSRWFSV